MRRIEAERRDAEGPPPRVFGAKSAESIEKIEDRFFNGAKECVRV
jgi:hypothetical protein